MAIFPSMLITHQGQTLYNKAQAGVPINFTKIKIGSGRLSDGQDQTILAGLIDYKFDVSISSITQNTQLQIAVISGRINNENITTGTYICELGLFAQDPDIGEILYAYTNAADQGDYYAPAERGPFTWAYQINAAVGNAANVTATLVSNSTFDYAVDVSSTFTVITGINQQEVNESIDKLINKSILALEESTGYGVISGLTVSAQPTPDMTVNVATGIVHMPNGMRLTPMANSNLIVEEADVNNPRVDIIYVKNDNLIGYLAGTPASSPTAPDTPSDAFLLARINVGENVTAITNDAIVDMRKMKVTTEELKNITSFTTIKTNYTATTNGISTIPIGHSLLNPIEDDLRVIYLNEILVEGVNYNVQSNNLNIELIDWELDLGDKIYFELLKKSTTPVTQSDGTLIQEGTISKVKLTQGLQDEISGKANKFVVLRNNDVNSIVQAFSNSLGTNGTAQQIVVINNTIYMCVDKVNTDCIVQKFDLYGSLLKQFTIPYSAYGRTYGITVDNENNIYVGTNTGKINKYDSQGNLLWSKQYPLPYCHNIYFYGEYIYITGIALIQIDKEGNELKNYNLPTNEEIKSVTFTSNNLYCARWGYQIADSIIKLDYNFQKIWEYALPHEGELYSHIMDRNENIICAADGYITKIDKDNNLLWQKTATGTQCYFIGVNYFGEVIYNFREQTAMIKLDPYGNQVWNKTLGAWNHSGFITDNEDIYCGTNDNKFVKYNAGVLSVMEVR